MFANTCIFYQHVSQENSVRIAHYHVLVTTTECSANNNATVKVTRNVIPFMAAYVMKDLQESIA